MDVAELFQRDPGRIGRSRVYRRMQSLECRSSLELPPELERSPSLERRSSPELPPSLASELRELPSEDAELPSEEWASGFGNAERGGSSVRSELTPMMPHVAGPTTPSTPTP